MDQLAQPIAFGETFNVEVVDGVYYGALTVGGVTFRQSLPEGIAQYPEEKQRYWMKRCIDQLRSKSKKLKTVERAKAERKLRIGKRIIQEQALVDQMTAMGIDRVESPETDVVSGYHFPDGTVVPDDSVGLNDE